VLAAEHQQAAFGAALIALNEGIPQASDRRGE
jgi:hypothetical protein